MPFPPAVVLCLGNTGVSVVQQLGGRLGAPADSAVRILVIASAAPGAALPGPADRFIRLNLAAGGARTTFRNPAFNHFWDFKHWLQAVPVTGAQLPVFVVASAAEVEAGLVSDVLVQLRYFPDRFNPLIGLFTLAAAESAVPLQPYGALREAGRFIFSGPHIVEDGPPFCEKLLNNSLLDHIVLCGRQGAGAGLNGASRGLSEGLYALLHGCSRQRLLEALNQALFHDAAGGRHVVVAHTLGAATVPIPAAERGGLPAAAAQLAGVAELCLANQHVHLNRYRLLIGDSLAALDAAVNIVFPFGAAAVNRLDCGETGQLSAVELRTNIALGEFDEVVEANLSFMPGMGDSCKQEENAQRYEHLFRVAVGAPNGLLRRELPAELTLALHSQQMATIFFQSLICGFVRSGGGNAGWFVGAVGGFGELSLAPDGAGGNNSLWHAFQVFTVWRPYAGSEVGNALHANTRVGYLNALHQAAKAKRLDPAFGAVQTAFLVQIAEWRNGAAADRVLGDFLDMLEVELRNPVWSGW